MIPRFGTMLQFDRDSALIAACAGVSHGQQPAEGGAEADRAQYVIGSGDHIRIWALGLEEVIDKPFVVDPEGYIQVPLAGRILVSGSKSADVQALLRRDCVLNCGTPRLP